jgi:hypothetical protein
MTNHQAILLNLDLGYFLSYTMIPDAKGRQNTYLQEAKEAKESKMYKGRGLLLAKAKEEARTIRSYELLFDYLNQNVKAMRDKPRQHRADMDHTGNGILKTYMQILSFELNEHPYGVQDDKDRIYRINQRTMEIEYAQTPTGI